uniref:hypothetical protein n=1 Tax=Aquipuribacter hungaricus TaxID=545624 RepID=UPI0030EB5F64
MPHTSPAASDTLPDGPLPARGPAAPSTTALAVVGVVGFLVLGVLSSALGPALPALRARHDLDAPGAALLLTAFSAGATAGVLLAGALPRRLPVSVLLVGGAAAVVVGRVGLP